MPTIARHIAVGIARPVIFSVFSVFSVANNRGEVGRVSVFSFPCDAGSGGNGQIIDF